MKIAFFGTPDFARNILAGVLEYTDVEVCVVVSQPNKPVGRKAEILPTPVAALGKERGIPVLQPASLKKHNPPISDYTSVPLNKEEYETQGSRGIVEILTNLNLDFIVVVAYGKIIPQSILDIPKYGCINIHGSILPAYRGASPVQSAVKHGLLETGLTIMFMDKKMDEGDILQIAKITVDKDDTSLDIFRKFTKIGPELLIDTLRKVMSGQLQGTPQDHEKATYCHMIEKQEGKVDFSTDSASEIYNKFRAFQPWPGVYSVVNGKKLGLEEVSLYTSPIKNSPPAPLQERGGATDVSSPDKGRLGGVLQPGNFIKLDKKTYGVICADKKILLLHQVKPEGKKSMDIVSFMNGNKSILHSKLC